MSNPDAIMVDGGIGGLSTAYALTRKGRRVRVLEQAPAFGEVGAGIQLAPTAPASSTTTVCSRRR